MRDGLAVATVVVVVVMSSMQRESGSRAANGPQTGAFLADKAEVEVADGGRR